MLDKTDTDCERQSILGDDDDKSERMGGSLRNKVVSFTVERVLSGFTVRIYECVCGDKRGKGNVTWPIEQLLDERKMRWKSSGHEMDKLHV